MAAKNSIKICIETFEDDAGYVAWIDNDKFKGIVVQSDSLKGVLEELLSSVKVKIACDLGIEIGGMDEKIASMLKELKEKKADNKELSFRFA